MQRVSSIVKHDIQTVSRLNKISVIMLKLGKVMLKRYLRFHVMYRSEDGEHCGMYDRDTSRDRIMLALNLNICYGTYPVLLY